MDGSLEYVPQEKWQGVALHPNEVLCATPQEMEAKLREVTDKCRGRKYHINTSGLTPITGNNQDYINCILAWTSAAKKVMAEQPEKPIDY